MENGFLAHSSATSFGSKIRQFRKEKGLSQQQVADMAGIERSHLSKIENGQSNARVETIYRLVSVLGCSVSDVIDTESDVYFKRRSQIDIWESVSKSIPLPMLLVDRRSGIIISTNNAFLRKFNYKPDDTRFISILNWIELKELPTRAMERSGRVRFKNGIIRESIFNMSPLEGAKDLTSIIIYLQEDNN